ncbi:MAG: oxidoreductase domain protein [Gemmatimonadetes bacterium]|nr:oxidoreductase domain protein [Gemmatimonadota bacterium]
MKKSETEDAISRREFVQKSALAVGVLAAPMYIPRRLFGASAPSNRIRVGHIGCGRIGQSHDFPGISGSGGRAGAPAVHDLAEILAVCDLDTRRAESGKKTVARLYADKAWARPDVAVYQDYHELLARPDIDAVSISLPDHQHAQVALTALMAGKDIYIQKPFTMTHAEGQMLREAVARTGRILQVGSQQRSWGPNEQFRKGVELVRSGRIGTLRRVEIGLPTDPTAPDNPPEPVPAAFNYDMWLGPTPEAYYTEQRVHPQGLGRDGGPDVASRPGWLRNENYSLGMITGWGAHHFDTAHWGMNMELSGPSKIEGKGEFPTNKIWNVHGAYEIQLEYPGKVIMRVSDKLPNGIRFIGDEGWIWVSRDGGAPATPSDPVSASTTGLKSLDASDKKLLDPAGVTVHLPASLSHHQNWLECVKSRKQPLAPAPIAHRSNTACILSWIAMKTGRPLTWDVNTEKFVNDEQANSMLTRPERGKYGALKMAASLKKG